MWKDTAIFITFDEGGGYYDSGYVQPLDFFGDGGINRRLATITGWLKKLASGDLTPETNDPRRDELEEIDIDSAIRSRSFEPQSGGRGERP